MNFRASPFFVTCLLMASASAFAVPDGTPLSRAESLFVETWTSGYVEARCGPNIEAFVDLLEKRGIPLDQAEVVEITNGGSSMFGMINAERGRTSNPDSTDEQNWYHHVVLLMDGHILDFDFTGEPTILPAHEYFEQMFLDEIPNPSRAFLRVGRDDKLSDYKLKLFPADRYTKSGGRENPTELRLHEFLSR